MILLTIRLWGEEVSYDGDVGWSSHERFLDTLTPENSPSIPDWPRLVAEAMRDQLGAEVLYVVPAENVPGRVY